MKTNKIIMFFCDYDVTHSNVGEKLKLDRKGEIKTFLNSLERLRINEDANQVLLTFISDNEEFKDNINSLVSQFSELIEGNNIILGNHFDHKFIYTCDGINSDNTNNILSYNSNAIIGDRISTMVEGFISGDKEKGQNVGNNEITSVRVARNSIGDTCILTNYLDENNISFMQYTFNHFNKSLPNDTKITYNNNRMYANWMDLSALNAVLSNELFRIKQQKLDKANSELPKQQIIVYKK